MKVVSCLGQKKHRSRGHKLDVVRMSENGECGLIHGYLTAFLFNEVKTDVYPPVCGQAELLRSPSSSFQK